MVSTGSSWSKSMTSAPSSRAFASRVGTRSIANTRPAFIIFALTIANSPTGPQPKIATVSPGVISASVAPKYAVGKMSDSRIA